MTAAAAYQTAIVASRLARLRNDGHAPQAEALLRLLEGRNVEPPVIASRHGRTLAPTANHTPTRRGALLGWAIVAAPCTAIPLLSWSVPAR